MSPLGNAFCHISELLKMEEFFVFFFLIKNHAGASRAVQWLRIHFALQRTGVPSLVRELSSHMLQGN